MYSILQIITEGGVGGEGSEQYFRRLTVFALNIPLYFQEVLQLGSAKWVLLTHR